MHQLGLQLARRWDQRLALQLVRPSVVRSERLSDSELVLSSVAKSALELDYPWEHPLATQSGRRSVVALVQSSEDEFHADRAAPSLA